MQLYGDVLLHFKYGSLAWGRSVGMAVVRVAGRRRLFLLALGAQRSDFGLVGGQCKAGHRHPFGQLLAHYGVTDLCDRSAAGTDDEQIMRGTRRIVAGCPGVDRIQTMNQALVDQKIQRPVNRGRRRTGVLGAYGIQQLVGLDAATVAQEQFQHLAADGRQPAAALLTERLGGAELFAYRVRARGKRRGGH